MTDTDRRHMFRSAVEKWLGNVLDHTEDRVVVTRYMRPPGALPDSAIDSTVSAGKTGSASRPSSFAHWAAQPRRSSRAAPATIGIARAPRRPTTTTTTTTTTTRPVRDVARRVPLDRLLVETDSPYLAPVPMRGKENEPAYVRHVAEFVAKERGMAFEELARATTGNFFRLFRAAAKT